MQVFVKSSPDAPEGFFEAEAAGLEFLRYAEKVGGAKVVEVVEFTNSSLTLERIENAAATPEKASQFGNALAKTHSFETQNAKWNETPSPLNYSFNSNSNPNKHPKRVTRSYFGPLSDPVRQCVEQFDNWKDYFFDGRLIPILEICQKRNQILDSEFDLVEELRNSKYIANLPKDFLNAHPSRVHGDLWSGNLLWSEEQAILIDPAAHFGSNEEDLAMLNLFGCPFYNEILEGYNQIVPLVGGIDGFLNRIDLHNLFPIAGHIAFFGGSYLNQFRNMVKGLLKD